MISYGQKSTHRASITFTIVPKNKDTNGQRAVCGNGALSMYNKVWYGGCVILGAVSGYAAPSSFSAETTLRPFSFER